MNLLFVCHGNTCRSPMAAGIAKRLTRSWPEPATIRSAGLWPGTRTAANAIEAVAEIGVDISDASPQEIDAVLVDAADLIVPLDRDYDDEIAERFPEAISKIRYLSQQIPDPFGSDIRRYRDVRNLLVETVTDLLRTERPNLQLDAIEA